MDDIKLFAENEKELKTLIQAERIYSEDIGIGFGIKQCALLIMKSRKRQMLEGIEVTTPPPKKKSERSQKRNLHTLGKLEANVIKQT